MIAVEPNELLTVALLEIFNLVAAVKFLTSIRANT
mgnify:CR=1 FL=1